MRWGNQAHVVCPECDGIILKPGCEFKEILKIKEEPKQFLPPGPWEHIEDMQIVRSKDGGFVVMLYKFGMYHDHAKAIGKAVACLPDMAKLLQDFVDNLSINTEYYRAKFKELLALMPMEKE